MTLPFALRAAVRAAAAGAAMLLVGCTTTSTTNPTTNPPPTAAPAELRDRMTASDEPDAVKRGRARMDLAAAYFGRGQMTTALDQIKLSIQADPTSSPAFNLRGLIYGNLGEPVLAEESFRRALQINPRDADAMQNFGWFLCQQRRYDEAERFFGQALSSPNYRDAPRTLLAQGVCQAKSGRLADADATLSRAYEAESGNPAIAVNLAEVLYQRGEYERARFYIRRLNNQPSMTSAGTLWLAARIEHRLGNRQGATDLGSQLVNRFPDAREAALFQRGAYDE